MIEMNWKMILVPLLILISISISANVYSFQKLANGTDENTKLLEKKEKEIADLQEAVTSLENNSNVSESEKKEENGVQETEQIASEESNLVNTTKRYLEYAFNLNPDNYVTAKNNAHNYMTDEMIDIIFVSDGVDEDFYMQIKNIKVYTTDATNKEVIAYYESEIETYDTTYVEKNYNYILLKFVEEDSTLKIASLTPINVAGAN